MPKRFPTPSHLGSYKVQIVAPSGSSAARPRPTVTITRGMCVGGVNLGLQKTSLAPTGLDPAFDAFGNPLTPKRG